MLSESSVDTTTQRLKRDPGCHWFVPKSNSRNDSSELTSVICDRTTDESKIEQLSGLDDGNEDLDLPSSYVIFGILLVFVDVSVIIIDLLVADNTMYIPLEYRSISLSIALFFFMDVLLRVFVEGTLLYFSDVVNAIDAVIIVVTLLIDFIYIFNDFEIFEDIPRLIIFLRSLRLIILMRVFHLAYQKRRLEKLARRMVSGNKRRYRKDGFDLDLTYVTGRIIAMSFPSSGQQAFYRNPIQEVVRFLDTKHRNHYQVYNLCSEKAYDPKYFHYRVHRLMVDDHNVPSLSAMVVFSKEVQKWMDQDDKNIVVIHCMGGKGRTGMMACAYLIACGIFATAEMERSEDRPDDESLHYFGERRTDRATSDKFQGVETPSQAKPLSYPSFHPGIPKGRRWYDPYLLRLQQVLTKCHSRYVEYFADVKNIYNLTLPPRKLLRIRKIVIYSIHGVGKGDGNDLEVQILMHQKIIFSCSASENCRIVHDVERDRVIIKLSRCPLLHDDVKVRFLSSALPKDYDNCPFFFWLHTSFIQNNRLYLSRDKLDNPHKPKTWKIYRPEFAVEIYFDAIDQVVADT